MHIPKDADTLALLIRDELQKKPDLKIIPGDSYDESFLWNASYYITGASFSWRKMMSDPYLSETDVDRLRVICDTAEAVCPESVDKARLNRVREAIDQWDTRRRENEHRRFIAELDFLVD